MGFIRSHSKISDNLIRVVAVSVWLLAPSSAWARFASQFSLLVGEGYSDNIFFSKDKEHDFVTVITPTLTLLYAPEGQTAPTLNLNLSPSGNIYARHSELNGFGDNMSATAGYTYQYSPRLSFHFSDTFQRQGEGRFIGTGEQVGQIVTGPTSPPPHGGVSSPPASQSLKDFLSRGDQLSNFLTFRGSFLYRPDISFEAGYTNSIIKFLDAGGTDIFHTVGARGVYNWRQDHNLHAGYWISISRPRDDQSSVIHNFDIGDDYFTNYNLQLTPTLSLAASTGLSVNIGSDGPRIANNSSVTITKVWDTAVLNAGLNKGLTPSYGVAGISDTTSLFTTFNLRLSEKLSTNANTTYSFFDTDDVNFKTFRAGLGFQYLFTSWLSSGINYYFTWIDSGSGANSTDLLEKGVVKSNTVFLSLTVRFDLWPNMGLARGMASPTLTPVIRTPFPTTMAPPSSTPSP
jgi:hypothetical protein